MNGKIIAGGVAVGITAIGLVSSASIIDSNEVGVEHFMGQAYTDTLKPGVHFLNPFAGVTKFKTAPQIFNDKGDIPTASGMNINMDADCVMKMDPAQAVPLYNGIRDNTAQFMQSGCAAGIKSATQKHSIEDFYGKGPGNDSVQTEAKAEVQNRVANYGFIVTQINFKTTDPPQSYKEAIALKNGRQLEMEGMEYQKQTAEKAADIKRIEAAGIHDYQMTASAGVNPQLISWEYGQAAVTQANALKQLADHPPAGLNVTLVVQGAGNGSGTNINLPAAK